MRLIDADRFLKMMSHWKPYMDMDNVREAIKKMPTIDAVPVVRCKDCSYWKAAKVNAKGFLICPASGMEITEDDYCSYGERKEDDT